MPPKCKFTREEVVEAGLNTVRSGGIDALTARAVGAALGASPKVIFGLFQNMDDLRGAVLDAAHSRYLEFLTREMESGKYPPYKGSGMGYIRFAREEPELFKLLFMRNRAGEVIQDNPEEIRPLLELIQKNTGLSRQDAYLLHLEMWICSHGIATMLASGYLEWDWDLISRMMTDFYQGVRSRFGKREE